MNPRVLITRVLPEPALEVVRQACEVQLDPLDQQLTPAALRQAVVDKQGVLCLITDRIDAPVLDAATELKVVSNVAVGYDNIDVAAATQRGILVTNTPGVVTESTADLTWSLLCSIACRIAEGDPLHPSWEVARTDPAADGGRRCARHNARHSRHGSYRASCGTSRQRF